MPTWKMMLQRVSHNQYYLQATYSTEAYLEAFWIQTMAHPTERPQRRLHYTLHFRSRRLLDGPLITYVQIQYSNTQTPSHQSTSNTKIWHAKTDWPKHGWGIRSGSRASTCDAKLCSTDHRRVDIFRETTCKAAKETIGHTTGRQLDWFDQKDPEISQEIEAKRKVKIEYESHPPS